MLRYWWGATLQCSQEKRRITDMAPQSCPSLNHFHWLVLPSPEMKLLPCLKVEDQLQHQVPLRGPGLQPCCLEALLQLLSTSQGHLPPMAEPDISRQVLPSQDSGLATWMLSVASPDPSWSSPAHSGLSREGETLQLGQLKLSRGLRLGRELSGGLGIGTIRGWTFCLKPIKWSTTVMASCPTSTTFKLTCTTDFFSWSLNCSTAAWRLSSAGISGLTWNIPCEGRKVKGREVHLCKLFPSPWKASLRPSSSSAPLPPQAWSLAPTQIFSPCPGSAASLSTGTPAAPPTQ